jgi:hypothetical protein
MIIYQLIGPSTVKRTAAHFARDYFSEKAGGGLVATALRPVQFRLGHRPLAPGLASLPCGGSKRYA